MRIKTLIVAMTAVASLAPIAAQAQSSSDNPWMVRVRAVYVDWQNGQSNGSSTAAGVQTNNINAKNQWLPEFDVSYFFTKNIAAELVLTWPQQVNITAGPGNTNIGKVTALPPSLLAQYHFTDLGAFKPYVGAGPSVFKVFGEKPGGSVTPLGVTKVKMSNEVGFALQAGVDIPLNDKGMGLSIEAKKYFMYTTAHFFAGNAEVLTTKHSLDPWVLSAGLAFRF